MIIRGNSVGSVAYWSSHLLRDDTNERAEVKEINGLLAEDLPTALREMEAIAAQSRCKGCFMYQANINPLANERLTPEQWKEAVDTLEKKLGLEGHQRVVVEHEKYGRVHRHVVWNRVDVETLATADMWRSHQKEMAIQAELENRFGLEPTPAPAADRKRAPELWEVRAAERSGIDRDEVRAEINELWKSTDSGKAFAAAVAESPYTLAKGDRRDFCIVDQAGDAHSLARCIEGGKAKDIRERMADVDRDSLPSVAEARAEQRAAERPIPEPVIKSDEPAPIYATLLDESDRTNFWDDVYDKRAARAEADQESWQKSGEAEVSRVTDSSPSVGEAALGVVDAVTGVTEKLADFILGLLGGGGSKPPPDPKKVSQTDEIRAERRARAAIDSMADSMARGERFKAEDIRNLTPTHLENIRLRGDDYVREMIERVERDRQRDRDFGRERER